MAKAKTPEVRRKIEPVTRTLKCNLTSQEVLDRSADLTNTMDELANIEQEFASAKEQFKARASESEAKVQRLKCEVRDRYVHRPVACERIHDYEAGTVEIIRTDLYERVEVRPMTQEERQTELELAAI